MIKAGKLVPKLRAGLSARHAVTLAMTDSIYAFPDLLRVKVDYSLLNDEREARLATAIHRTTIQRWQTLSCLLSYCVRQPWVQIEPTMQGVLVTAAAQVVFMDRLPRYAVIDESVKLARLLVRPGAAGLANAVLRKLSDAVGEVSQEPWVPARDRIPMDTGVLKLNMPWIPSVDPLDEHLAFAVSIPVEMAKAWIERYGPEKAMQLARQVVLTPPIVIAVEPGFVAAVTEEFEPHNETGFIVWRGTHEAMIAFLAANPLRRVQDSASSYAVDQLVALVKKTGEPVNVIVDFCAGRGTKTRQLANAFPNARIIAADPDKNRLLDLEALAASNPKITAVHSESLAPLLHSVKADVVLLDVPCSNTAVLARRPEAKYRVNEETMSSLLTMQRQIMMLGSALIRPSGLLVYSTCSLEEAENEAQADWTNRRFKSKTITMGQVLPSGEPGAGYHDGAFHAILRGR